MKYFSEDSEEKMFFVLENRGITDNRLISRPIHILNQEYDDTEISVPITIDLKKMILNILTKKRKVYLSFTGYEPISLI